MISRRSNSRERCLRPIGLALSAAALLLAAANANAVAYRFTDLGIGNAVAINDVGQIVGESGGHAVQWNGAVRTDLGIGRANGVNDAGQVVGYINSSEFGPGWRASVWNGVARTDLGAGGAFGINNAGQVVGYSGHDGQNRATLWNGTTPTDLGSSDEQDSNARAINSVGQVAGSRFIYEYEAILWNGTEATQLGGPTGLPTGFAKAINDRGQIVGDTYCCHAYGEASYATLWDGAEKIDLTPLGAYSSLANDINNRGTIVGSSGTGFEPDRATLWNGTAPMDLNSFLPWAVAAAGWQLTEAHGVNEHGWIVGSANNALTGENHAFLLTPVPEPETFVLMLAGLGVLALALRRHKGQLPMRGCALRLR